MPAVTVENVLTLPRVDEPAGTAVSRPVRSVTTAPQGFEGEGFPVRRAFAGVDLADLDPFIHMDQMGEVEYAPGEPKGTPWHPHRGFETVTYIIDGTFEHQDSHGGGGVITNGDTQWMTAGGPACCTSRRRRSTLVAERRPVPRPPAVGQPAEHEKMSPPRYQDIRGGEVALLATPDGGALVRVIAGELDGHAGPGITHTPITHRPRHRRARRPRPPAVEPGLQRPRLRPQRARHRRARPSPAARWASSPCSAPATSSRSAADDSQESREPEPRRLRPGRPADPRAGRGLRPVRHEHPRRADAGVRGLPGRAPRHHPVRAAPRPRRPLTARPRQGCAPRRVEFATTLRTLPMPGECVAEVVTFATRVADAGVRRVVAAPRLR